MRRPCPNRICLAPIPTPGEAIPSSSRIYYAERSGTTLVRADVTYLKQDFSVMQAVKKQWVWPEKQRFDYLVRVRPLTPKELVGFDFQQNTARPLRRSDHKWAILNALRVLTERDGGTTIQGWHQVLCELRHEQLRAGTLPGDRTPALK